MRHLRYGFSTSLRQYSLACRPSTNKYITPRSLLSCIYLLTITSLMLSFQCNKQLTETKVGCRQLAYLIAILLYRVVIRNNFIYCVLRVLSSLSSFCKMGVETAHYLNLNQNTCNGTLGIHVLNSYETFNIKAKQLKSTQPFWNNNNCKTIYIFRLAYWISANFRA